MQNDLQTRLADSGPLPFREFMAWALYDPDHGYYADPERVRIGRQGDFITSVAVGPLFGALLAGRFRDLWKSHGRPAPFTIIEAGPEDGQLARDILAGAQALDPAFREALLYAAVEPMDRKREALTARLAEERGASVHASAEGISGGFGVVLANEVLDALPVDLLSFTGGRWHERRVALNPDGSLALVPLPLETGPLADFAAGLGSRFPDPYHTEASPDYRSFLAPHVAALDRALVVLIDYGFPAEDYYHPARTGGHLRTYRGHQATDDPLLAPGGQDITSHVNFSAVEDAARSLGLRPGGLVTQELYFTRLMAPLLATLDPDHPSTPSTLRQFRTLTHPAFLGTKFHVWEGSRHL